MTIYLCQYSKLIFPKYVLVVKRVTQSRTFYFCISPSSFSIVVITFLSLSYIDQCFVTAERIFQFYKQNDSRYVFFCLTFLHSFLANCVQFSFPPSFPPVIYKNSRSPFEHSVVKANEIKSKTIYSLMLSL